MKFANRKADELAKEISQKMLSESQDKNKKLKEIQQYETANNQYIEIIQKLEVSNNELST